MSHVTVVTVVRDRLDHLERQVWGLERQSRRADLHVVVRTGADVRPVLAAAGAPPSRTRVVDLGAAADASSLGGARAAGVAEAAGFGTTVLLDAACIPSPGALRAHEHAVAVTGSVVAAAVHDLPPATLATSADLGALAGAGTPSRAWPRHTDGPVAPSADWNLLDTAAMAAPTRLLRELADLGDPGLVASLRARGAALHLVAGAVAWRQHREASPDAGCAATRRMPVAAPPDRRWPDRPPRNRTTPIDAGGVA